LKEEGAKGHWKLFLTRARWFDSKLFPTVVATWVQKWAKGWVGGQEKGRPAPITVITLQPNKKEPKKK